MFIKPAFCYTGAKGVNGRIIGKSLSGRFASSSFGYFWTVVEPDAARHGFPHACGRLAPLYVVEVGESMTWGGAS